MVKEEVGVQFVGSFAYILWKVVLGGVNLKLKEGGGRSRGRYAVASMKLRISILGLLSIFFKEGVLKWVVERDME